MKAANILCVEVLEEIFPAPGVNLATALQNINSHANDPTFVEFFIKQNVRLLFSYDLLFGCVLISYTIIDL